MTQKTQAALRGGADMSPLADKAISRATGNRRQWNKNTLFEAYRAATPVAEQELRGEGQAFTRDEVRSRVRLYVRGYANKYGVILPPSTILGSSELETVAADICGALGFSWTSFIPTPIRSAMNMAKKGEPRAQEYLSKIFKKNKTPASAIPLATSATPTKETETTETAGDNDSLGAWIHKLNPLYWVKPAQERALIDKEKRAWIEHAEAQKALGKREETLAQAEKTEKAQAALKAAAARSAEIETQLKSIESQLSGACVGKAEIIGKETAKHPVSEEDAHPVLEKIHKARQLNAQNLSEIKPICDKIKQGRPLLPEETSKILILLARNERLHEFSKGIVSGELYAYNPARKIIQTHAVVGAVKAMTPSEKQMMAQMVAMAKKGNANAQRALAALKAQGYSVTMSGWGISDAFKLALKPVTVPLKYAGKGLKWTGKKLGIISSSPSAEKVRLKRLQAAAKRRQAATARARAADAESEAEARVQQQLAAAADAEADAADAEASAREAKMMSAEAQFTPAEGTEEEMTADQAGRDVKPVITPLPPSPTVDKLKTARRTYIAKKSPRAAAILAKSEEQTPGGMKLRASMELYKKSLHRGSRENAAVRKMIKRARAGDKQARSDILALKAARIAVIADKKAAKHVARVAQYRAVDARGKARQKRLEVAIANKLVQRSRARQLAKVSRIERKAAAGDPRARKIVARTVDKAKKGDKGAQKIVMAMKLTRQVRKTAPNKRERRNLRLANRLVKRVNKGDKHALAQLRVMRAAAKHGNPNAKRGLRRVQVAAATQRAIETGALVLPATVLTAAALKKSKKQQAKNRRTLSSVQDKIDRGTATREEALAGAKAASALGDKARAGELAALANTLPSAQAELKRAAVVAAASEAGHPASMRSVAAAEKAAETGDPGGVAAMGKLAAVKNLDQVSKGRDLDPPMKEAVKDIEAAQVGDPTARSKIAAMQAGVEKGKPEAIKYMVYATGATIVARALASNQKAQEQWKEKAGVIPASTVNEEVKVAIEDKDPRSTLSAPQLGPIEGVGELVVASLQAIFMATPDPLGNYREGVASRGKLGPTTTTAGEESTEFTDASDPVYFPGPLLRDRYDTIVKLAQKGDAKAKRALTEIRAKGIDKKVLKTSRDNIAPPHRTILDGDE